VLVLEDTRFRIAMSWRNSRIRHPSEVAPHPTCDQALMLIVQDGTLLHQLHVACRVPQFSMDLIQPLVVHPPWVVQLLLCNDRRFELEELIESIILGVVICDVRYWHGLVEVLSAVNRRLIRHQLVWRIEGLGLLRFY